MENKMNFEYKLIDTIGVDHEKYKILHNLLFKGAATTSEWILWYHKEIGRLKSWSTGTRTWGVFYENELIGIWSVEPKKLKNNANFLNVGRCFAVGIHPDYRRHGLFVSLSEYAIRQEKIICEYEYILGFPQVGRTVIGGHFKAGWEEVMSINIYSYTNESREFGFSRTNVNFSNNYEDLVLNNESDGIIENSAYNNLRWIKHPDHQYLTYTYKSSSIVLKTFSNFCHILDLSGAVNDVAYLLGAVKSLAVKHGWVEVNIWCSDKEIYKEVLINSGFIEGAEFGLAVSMIAVRINAKTPLILGKCTIQMGVEEGY
jgi:hypothetical protein